MTQVTGFNRGYSTVLAIVIATFVVSSPAQATVMVEVGVDDMAADADAIIVGQVIHSAVQMVLRDGSLEPHTVTRIRVNDWLHGGNAAEITVRELGGETEQLGGMWISGTPRYEVGEEVLVFLRRDPLDPTAYRTYGMTQGKFVIRRGTQDTPSFVYRDLEGISFASFADGETQLEHPEAGPRLQLERLLEQVRRVLAQLEGAE